MKHTTIHALGARANVIAQEALVGRALRRARLERLAALLDMHETEVRLLSRMEYVPRSQRDSLQVSNSPITVAYLDPVFRAEGLASDRLGDAMKFFALTASEAHHLLCDCHYGALPSHRISSRCAPARLPRSGAWASAGSTFAALSIMPGSA